MKEELRDLGYINGWTPGSEEQKLWEWAKKEAKEKGYKWECYQVYPNRGIDDVYTCYELGIRYHVDSSD